MAAKAAERSATSAERQEVLAARQLWLSIAGIFALLVTIGYSIKATKAAVRSADLAEKAVAETRRIGEAQVRAYVAWNSAIVGIGLDQGLVPISIILTPMIKNTGQSPARLVGLYSYGAFIEQNETPECEFVKASAACHDELGAGNEFAMADQQISMDHAHEVYEGQKKYFVMGWIGYRDVFWVEGSPDRVATFCFEVKFRIPPRNTKKENINHFFTFNSRTEYEIRAV